MFSLYKLLELRNMYAWSFFINVDWAMNTGRYTRIRVTLFKSLSSTRSIKHLLSLSCDLFIGRFSSPAFWRTLLNCTNVSDAEQRKRNNGFFVVYDFLLSENIFCVVKITVRSHHHNRSWLGTRFKQDLPIGGQYGHIGLAVFPLLFQTRDTTAEHLQRRFDWFDYTPENNFKFLLFIVQKVYRKPYKFIPCIIFTSTICVR